MIVTTVRQDPSTGGGVSERADPVRLSQGVVIAPCRCSCGTRISPGSSAFEFEAVPEALRPMLADRTFCSPQCARAFLLEAMELLDTPGSSSLLADVRQVYWSLEVLYTIVDNQVRTGGLTATGHRLR